jgi:hypothetical protein
MLKITRRLVRETAVGPLIVELHPGYVVFRPKRMRYRYSADWGTLYRFVQGLKPNVSLPNGGP